MKNKLFVGGLSWDTTEEALKSFFEGIGITVEEAKIIFDKFTKRSKGFGFVTLSTDEEATKAVEQLNGKELDGRAVNVSYARPERKDRGNFNQNSNPSF